MAQRRQCANKAISNVTSAEVHSLVLRRAFRMNCHPQSKHNILYESLPSFRKNLRTYINTPAVFLNGRRLSFTVKYKYLGTLMTHDGSDEANLSRQRGFFYARSNGLSKNFNACSPSVKATLFRTFCSNMYCGHLWHDFRKSALTISVRQAAVAAQRTMTFQYDRPLERHS